MIYINLISRFAVRTWSEYAWGTVWRLLREDGKPRPYKQYRLHSLDTIMDRIQISFFDVLELEVKSIAIY